MAKTEQLQLRVSPEQKARIKWEAQQAGDDVSTWVLRRLLPPAADELQRLIDTLNSPQAELSLALVEIHDFLNRQTTTDLHKAVRSVNLSGLGSFESNYLAAMVETACANKGVPAPAWSGDVAPLSDPWFASNLKSLRLHLLTSSPPPFRRRNLFVDSTLGSRV